MTINCGALCTISDRTIAVAQNNEELTVALSSITVEQNSALLHFAEKLHTKSCSTVTMCKSLGILGWSFFASVASRHVLPVPFLPCKPCV